MKGVEAIAQILKREGTEFLACFPYQPLIEACAKVGIPAGPVPTGADRHGDR